MGTIYQEGHIDKLKFLVGHEKVFGVLISCLVASSDETMGGDGSSEPWRYSEACLSLTMAIHLLLFTKYL